jgi:hypothetical protein
MSFKYCVDGVLTLIQLAWRTVEEARRACGEHDDLTKEVSRLYATLEHLRAEMTNFESPINRAKRSRMVELQTHLRSSEAHLQTVNSVLIKYNALGDEERSGRKLWQKIRFGNGEVKDLAEIILNISICTTAITMSLHLISLGSQGRVERLLSHQRGHLKGVRKSVNLVLARLNSRFRERSIMAIYSNDEKGFWKCLRRELVKDGFRRDVLHGKKGLILAYVKELGARGVLGDSTSFQIPLATYNNIQPAKKTCAPASLQDRITSACTESSNSNAIPQTIEPGVLPKHVGNTSQTFTEALCVRKKSPFSMVKGQVSDQEFCAQSDHPFHSSVFRNRPLSRSTNGSSIPDLEDTNTDVDSRDRDLSDATSWHDSSSVNTAEYEHDSYIVSANARVSVGTSTIQQAGRLLMNSSPYACRNVTDSSEWLRAQYEEFVGIQTGLESFDKTLHHTIGKYSRNGSMAGQEKTIGFQDPLGREFKFPCSLAKTWNVSCKLLLGTVAN